MSATLPPKKENSLLINSVGIIFILITLVGIVPNLLTKEHATWTAARTAVFIGGGVLYLFMGTVGWDWLVEQERRFGVLVYFTCQIALVTYLQWLSLGLAGTGWILMMPIAGQSVDLPRWAMPLVPLALMGSSVWVFTRYTPLSQSYTAVLTLGAAMAFTLVFTYVTVREGNARSEVERLAYQLQLANQQLREYAVQAEELATTKERNRLAREIHDSLGHYLTVINVQLEAAQVVLETDPARARNALEKSQKLAQEGLQEVRRSVAALRESPIESRPLPDVVDELLQENRAAGIVTELHIQGEPRPLDPRVSLTLYRVAQEGLTNARKHARASRIDVVLDYASETAVSLTIKDNGIGADTTSGGFGLLGLQERVALLQGELTLETAVRQGFALHVTLPTLNEPLATHEGTA